MSAIGGPNIGKETLDKVIFSFSPEESGISQPTTVGIVTPAPPFSMSAFNATTSSLSPFYEDSGFDGWWGNAAAVNTRPEIASYALDQSTGLYTSFRNNNTAFQSLKYQVSDELNSNFLIDGITICGFIKVDRFPRIAQGIKHKLGIVTIGTNNPEGLNLSRIGVRLSNDDTKFCFGSHFTFFNNLRLSLCTDYVYDTNTWYFYSAHFKYNSDNSNIQSYMTINGEKVTTHTDNGFAFFNRRTGYIANSYNKPGTSKNDTYPLYPGFKVSLPNTVANGVRNLEHSKSASSEFQNASNKWDYANLSPSSLTVVPPYYISFLELRKRRGLAGLHDNISLGQHFVINDYDASVEKIYSSYKSSYL